MKIWISVVGFLVVMLVVWGFFQSCNVFSGIPLLFSIMILLRTVYTKRPGCLKLFVPKFKCTEIGPHF